jgi:hypothetical protein
MTYRLQMQGSAKRLEREHQQMAWAVWHTVTLPGQKPFPTLSEFTGIKKVVRRMTADEMKAKFRAMREAG